MPSQSIVLDAGIDTAAAFSALLVTPGTVGDAIDEAPLSANAVTSAPLVEGATAVLVMAELLVSEVERIGVI